MINIFSMVVYYLVVIIWGYFSDLRSEEYIWFGGRLIFATVVLLLLKQFLSKNGQSKQF